MLKDVIPRIQLQGMMFVLRPKICPAIVSQEELSSLVSWSCTTDLDLTM